MAEKEFNLLAEPWIRVMTNDCSVIEVSLTDAIIRAHEYRGLAGELPTQDAAVLRLLLAVLHTVFGRVDVNGDKAPIEEFDNALDRWGNLWDCGRFPEKPIMDYLETQKENFWLFHPTRPFWQAENLNKTQSIPISKINGAVSESGNKARLFSERSDKEKAILSKPELARWLISLNQYDDNSLKTGLGVGYLGQFTAVIAVGTDLFRTLMLNFVLLDSREEPWDTGKPSWEKYAPDALETIPFPHSQIEIMSYHSRYGKYEEVKEELKYVSDKKGYVYNEITFDEQMALWKKEKDVIKLLQIKSGKQIWREFGSLITDKTDKNEECSVLVKWHRLLADDKMLDNDTLLKYSVVGIEYDHGQRSSVENVFSDSLQLHLNLLSDLGKIYRQRIGDEIEKCNKIAAFIGFLAKDLFIASGGDEEKKGNDVFNSAKEQYFHDIDIPFRKWLVSLNASDTSEELENKIRLWRNEAKEIANELAEKLCKAAGPAAYVGKSVGEKQKRYYCTSSAMLIFRHNMKKM